MNPDDFKFGMVPPDSPAADQLPGIDEVLMIEAAGLLQKQAAGTLTDAEAERLRDLTTYRTRPPL